MRSARFLIIAILGLLLLSSNSCQKGNPSGIPYVPVNFLLTVSNPDFAPLQAIGGWLYLTGGSRGIIVYRFSQDEFKAYDRHCTFQIDEGCRVDVEESIFGVDNECCDSKFLIIDGAPIDGPAAIGLQQYNTQFDGNTLLITN